jgi:hypothetical protein
MNDFLRNKRDIEFQKRVIAALDRSKPSRWWAFFNSRVFSVLALGMFGAVGSIYFANYHQCHRDADRMSESWYRLTREAMTRHEALWWIIKDAKGLDDLRNFRSPSVYSEMKDKTLWEILREKRHIARRIDFSATRDIQPSKPRPSSGYSMNELFRYGKVPVGLVPPELSDEELPQIKAFSEKYLNIIFYDYTRDLRLYILPKCGLLNVLKSVIGKPTTIMESSLMPAESVIY